MYYLGSYSINLYLTNEMRLRSKNKNINTEIKKERFLTIYFNSEIINKFWSWKTTYVCIENSQIY